MESLSILVVDDEKITAFYLRDLLLSAHYEVQLAQNGEEALEILHKRRFNLVITDLVMPGIDGFALVKKVKHLYPDILIFILTAHGSYDVARKAQALGADDYLLKPVNPDQLHIALTKAGEKSYLKNKVASLGKLIENNYATSNIIGNSEPMREVFRLIEKARNSNGHVLIRGESGTGKELVARAIYGSEVASKGNFVIVNCCAISDNLIESELFGHTRGAFSGAISDREGLFEMADGGMIFLDEIGDVPIHSQTKLLRILQEGEFRRVGENKVRHIDVRVIAATNKVLEDAVKSGSFREDLFYRLNVIPIHLPPLRSRVSDIPLLVRHFVSKHQRKNQPRIDLDPEAMVLLTGYDFPGNIRELENLVQRAISFSNGSTITVSEIAGYLRNQPQSHTESRLGSMDDLKYRDLKNKIQILERDYILIRLKSSGGNVSEAAKAMEITRTALHNRMKKLGIDPKDYRGE